MYLNIDITIAVVIRIGNEDEVHSLSFMDVDCSRDGLKPGGLLRRI